MQFEQKNKGEKERKETGVSDAWKKEGESVKKTIGKTFKDFGKA